MKAVSLKTGPEIVVQWSYLEQIGCCLGKTVDSRWYMFIENRYVQGVTAKAVAKEIVQQESEEENNRVREALFQKEAN